MFYLKILYTFNGQLNISINDLRKYSLEPYGQWPKFRSEYSLYSLYICTLFIKHVTVTNVLVVLNGSASGIEK